MLFYDAFSSTSLLLEITVRHRAHRRHTIIPTTMSLARRCLGRVQDAGQRRRQQHSCADRTSRRSIADFDFWFSFYRVLYRCDDRTNKRIIKLIFIIRRVVLLPSEWWTWLSQKWTPPPTANQWTKVRCFRFWAARESCWFFDNTYLFIAQGRLVVFVYHFRYVIRPG